MATTNAAAQGAVEDFEAVMEKCDKHFKEISEGKDLFELLAEGEEDIKNGRVKEFTDKSMSDRFKRLGI